MSGEVRNAMKAVLFVGLAGLVSWGVSAQGLPSPPSAAGTDEKKICRTEKMTGSLTRVRRICLTAKEWDDLRHRTQQSFQDKVNGASGGCMAGGDGGMCAKPGS
jgi:hypothetical protein